MHEQKLAKLRQYITVFPSHLNNIFSEIFQTFTEFNEKLCDFTIANDISQNFSSITLGFREISKYFVDFRVRFWYFRKMTAKLQFLSNRFKISKFHTFQWRKLKNSISQLPNANALAMSVFVIDTPLPRLFFIVLLIPV